MALNIFPLSCQDAVCEVLLGEEPREDSQHVVLMIVPFQAVLLKLPRTHLPSFKLFFQFYQISFMEFFLKT